MSVEKAEAAAITHAGRRNVGENTGAAADLKIRVVQAHRILIAKIKQISRSGAAYITAYGIDLITCVIFRTSNAYLPVHRITSEPHSAACENGVTRTTVN